MQVPWKVKGLEAGARGLWSDPRVRAAIDCGEMDQGDLREEIPEAIACEGKPGSHGSKVILLSHV